MSSDHQPIQRTHEEFMNDLAAMLDNILNGKDGQPPEGEREWGYVVCIFPFGADEENENRFNYISNARREDVVALMKEMAAKFEGRHIDVKQKEAF